MQEQIEIVASDQGTEPGAGCPLPWTGTEYESVEVTQESANISAMVLSSESDFDAMEEEWDQLVSSGCQDGGFFLRWHWNRVWWRMYAPPQSELFLIACRDRSGQLVGLAPLYRHRRSIKGLFEVQEICFIGTGTELLTSEHLDIIARNGYQHLVGQRVADCIQQQSAWQRVWLWGIHATSPVLPHFSKAFGNAATVTSCDRLPYVGTHTDWATVKLGFGANLRTNIDRYIRRTRKDFTCHFYRAQTPAQLEEFMDAFVQLHQERWQSKGESGSFAYPKFKEFMQETVGEAFRRHRARLWMLLLDGQCVAVLQAFMDRGVAHYFQGGFKSGYEKYHLGSVLLGLSVQDCLLADDVDEFDLMGGGDSYKDHWTKTAQESIQIEVLRPGFRPVLFAFIRYCAGIYRRILPETVRNNIRTALGALAPSSSR